jgi:hypothetical protein
MTTTTTGVGRVISLDPSLLLPCAAFIITTLLFLYQLLVSRPRSKGGSSGPPVVTTSPVSKLPVVATILEFGQSPVKMVKRCYDEYGPVFTVPVRHLSWVLTLFFAVWMDRGGDLD